MAMTITPHDDTEFETAGRRRKITKFALAGVAVLGVGAALTSAAWSDNVWFAGEASTGTLDLVGSADNGASWDDGEPIGDAIQIPLGSFADVGPNIDVTHRLWVRNDGSLDVQLDAAQLDSVVGDLFVGDVTDPALPPAKAATVDIGPWSTSVIGTGDMAWVDVTVEGGNWIDNEYQGAIGTLVIHVQGTSIANP